MELGSTKCNGDGDDFWWLHKSWSDDAQNCLPGCISRMNEKNWDEACCEYRSEEEENPDNGGCIVYKAADVIQGDENSSKNKAVKCQGTIRIF